jgi:hypothetical protein
VPETVEEEDVTRLQVQGRDAATLVVQGVELCGRSTPTREYAQRTRPEQSKPAAGDSPPQRYGVPTVSTANRAAFSPFVGGSPSYPCSGVRTARAPSSTTASAGAARRSSARPQTRMHRDR